MAAKTTTEGKSLPLHPGSQPPSYEASFRDWVQTDVLLYRIFYNQLNSPLVRLPDHILVNIMRSSDLESLLKLRHTSRIFMVLFSVNPAFRSLHLTSDDHQRFYDTARLWEVPRTIIPTHQEAFFFRDRHICQSCLKRRKGDPFGRTLLSSMPVLFCSGCRTTHREMHFSARMRIATDDDRVCVGHECHLDICPHKTMTLQQAKVDAASGAKSLICPYDHDTSRPTCGSNTCPADNRPQVQAYYDKYRKLRVKLSFTSHIKVKRLQNGKICPSSLREELTRSCKSQDTGKWYQLLTGSVNDEMRIFDPNVCDCVDYYRDLPSTQRQRPIRICPAPAIARWQEVAPEGGYVSETGRCAYMRHGFTLDTVGIQLRVDFLKCHDVTKEMLAMRKTLDCEIDPHAASSAGWADLVSWMSFDAITDKKQWGWLVCPRDYCDLWRLPNYDVHLRAIEAKQIQRGRLVSTTTRMPKERQDGGDEDDDSGATMMAKQ